MVAFRGTIVLKQTLLGPRCVVGPLYSFALQESKPIDNRRSI